MSGERQGRKRRDARAPVCSLAGNRVLQRASAALSACFFFLLTLPTPAHAQTVNIDATVDRYDVVQGEAINLNLDVTVVGAGEVMVGEPPGADFRVINRSRVSQFEFISNGRRVLQYSQRMTVVATGSGEVTLGPIPINVGGSIHYTEPIRIRVAGGGPLAAPPAAAPPGRSPPVPPPIAAPPQQGAERQPPMPDLPPDLSPARPFAAASPSSRRVYVGEQLFADYELFSPQLNPFSAVGISQPSFPGFWFTAVDDVVARDHEEWKFCSQGVAIPTREQCRRADSGRGFPFEADLITRFVLVPLEPGRRQISAMQISTANRLRQRLDLSSPPVEIEVMDLPDGAPGGFSRSNVGAYEFSMSVEPSGLRVGDSIRVVMRAEGAGLANLLELPALAVAGRANVQPPIEERDQRLVNNRTVWGHTQAEIVVIPSAEGELTIGPVTFHSFDPQTGQYVAQTAEAHRFEISGYSPTAGLVLPVEAEDEQSTLLAALSPARDSTLVDEPSRLPPSLFWMLALAPPVLYLAVGATSRLTRRRRRSAPARKRRSALGRARRVVDQAARAGRTQSFGLIASAVRQYLRDRLEIKAGALTLEETGAALRERGASEELVDEVVSVLEQCELLRFSSYTGEDGELQSIAESASRTLKALERCA